MKKPLCVVSLLFFLLCTCTEKMENFFREPDISPVRNVLKAAMPLAYTANLTMAALHGEKLPNVTIARTGSDTSTGCFLIYISVDSAFPLPGNVRARGKIIAGGLSVDSTTAILTAVFTDMDILQGKFTLKDVSTFPVVTDPDIIDNKKKLIVVFSDMDINAGSDTLLELGISPGQITAEWTRFQTMKSLDSGIAIKESGWIIRVDDNGTPSNAYDDTYVICGGGQYIEVNENQAQIVQVSMFDAAMSPSCKNNPTKGYAF
jgi:hypothetical protein